MKKKVSLIVNIPNPCTQSWNDMNPVEGGSFCLHCQKTVVDFLNMTDPEIIAALSVGKEHRCGRFLPEQLNRVLKVHNQSRRSFLPAAMLTTLIAAITPDRSEAKDLADTTVLSIIPEKDSVIEINPPGLFTGEIIDAHTNEPLAHITMALKNDEIPNLGTVTDDQGRFTFHIPNRLMEQPLTFKISSVGYDTKEVRFDIDKIPLPAKISLQPSNMSLKELTVTAAPGMRRVTVVMGSIVDVRRPGWWQRVKFFFRRIVHRHGNCAHHS